MNECPISRSGQSLWLKRLKSRRHVERDITTPPHVVAQKCLHRPGELSWQPGVLPLAHAHSEEPPLLGGRRRSDWVREPDTLATLLPNQPWLAAANADRSCRAYHSLEAARAAGLQPVMEAVNSAKHLLAGALSAVVSRTCCAPLERVKMQMIFQQRAQPPLAVAWGILRQEGLPGFWRGNGARRACNPPMHASWQHVFSCEANQHLSVFANWLCATQASTSCGQRPTRCSSAHVSAAGFNLEIVMSWCEPHTS